MNIHEYQAKQLLALYNVPVPVGLPILSKDDVSEVITQMQDKVLVVKAQIHAGGRGKAGGVKVVKTHDDAIEEANAMFGKTLVTHQTGPKGKEVLRVYVEEGSAISEEYYLSVVVDRETSSIVFIASREGGVEIEEVATKTPEKISKISVDIKDGLEDHHTEKLAKLLGFDSHLVSQLKVIMSGMYDVISKHDALQVEINPLVKTIEGDLIALDAKMEFDDNALYRHDEISKLRDFSEEDPSEIEASKYGLNYVKMDGNIGCMVNGAGLAMATMDIIKYYGLSPANFLDVGGGATKENVSAAFKIILSDENVKGVLVNIFGGIMHCDVIADGIIAAVQETKINVPLVVRLSGTNFQDGCKILKDSNLNIVSASDLGEAAQNIVNIVKDNGGN